MSLLYAKREPVSFVCTLFLARILGLPVEGNAVQMRAGISSCCVMLPRCCAAAGRQNPQGSGLPPCNAGRAHEQSIPA